MKRLSWNWSIALLFAAAGVVGCNKAKNDVPSVDLAPPSQPEQTALAAAPPRQVPAEAAPDQVVTVFLDAMRAGDAPTVDTLLTNKAREETRKHQMPVEPMAAPNAQFEVAPPQYLPMNPDGAHVQARWVETDGMTNFTHTVIWVLRRQTEGWRIAGFAIELNPGQGPQFLNFEDPIDMMNKYKEALAFQAAVEAQAAAQQAAQPANPAGTFKK
jgi:hypothetical protein